jgi:hypothetical protein
MTIKQAVSQRLLACLNQEMTLEALVDWAENSFYEGGFGPDEDLRLFEIS